MSDLKTSIIKSIEDSVDVISSTYPDDDFFTVAVSTDTDLESLMISANSYQNLSKVLSKQSVLSRLTDRKYLKWCREEWASFDGFSGVEKIRHIWDAPYQIKNKLITNAHDRRHEVSNPTNLSILGNQKDRNEPIYHNAEFLLSTICMALREIKNSTWEKLNTRSELLLFCTFEPDQEESVRWNSAKQLNSGILRPKILREFRKVCKS